MGMASLIKSGVSPAARLLSGKKPASMGLAGSLLGKSPKGSVLGMAHPAFKSGAPAAGLIKRSLLG